jgi:hypothetical protein
VITTATKHVNKRFISQLGVFFLTSLFGLKNDFGLDG